METKVWAVRVFLRGEEVANNVSQRLKVIIGGKEVLSPGKVMLKRPAESVPATYRMCRKLGGRRLQPNLVSNDQDRHVFVVSSRLNQEDTKRPWFLRSLSRSQMAFAIARAVQPGKRSFKELVKIVQTHSLFLRMMGKGHLYIDSKMRMFWDYVGDMYNNDKELAQFVFMRGKHDCFSPASLRLAFTLSFLLQNDRLSLNEYADLFFKHKEITNLQNNTLFLQAKELDMMFESLCPFVEAEKKEVCCLEMHDAVSLYIPI